MFAQRNENFGGGRGRLRVRPELITLQITGEEKVISEDDFIKAAGRPIWGQVLKRLTREWAA